MIKKGSANNGIEVSLCEETIHKIKSIAELKPDDRIKYYVRFKGAEEILKAYFEEHFFKLEWDNK